MQALQLRPRAFTSSKLAPARLGVSSVKTVAPRQAPSSQAMEPTVSRAAAAEAVGFESSGDFGSMPTENVKLRVRMRGYDKDLLADAVDEIQSIADATGAKFVGPVMLPTKRRIYCVLRSPHANKDSREHFEIRTHNRLVDVSNLSVQTIQALMDYSAPSGVEMESSLVGV